MIRAWIPIKRARPVTAHMAQDNRGDTLCGRRIAESWMQAHPSGVPWCRSCMRAVANLPRRP